MKKLFPMLFFILTNYELVAQKLTFFDSVAVDSKIWSRDSNRNIQYADWKKFYSHTVKQISNFIPISIVSLNKFGSDFNGAKLKASGYFRTDKINGRSWLVDPEGYLFYNIAINGVRLGKSPDNEKAFKQKFGNTATWIADSKKIFDEVKFNTTGSWSDVESIINYNQTAITPIVYCTQLSLLGGFSQNQKKTKQNKEYPVLANIFDASFETWCDQKNATLVKNKSDQNLFGHFSDNELPFQDNLLKDFLAIENKNEPAYIVALNWIKEKNIDTLKISKEQREAFSGYVAEKYYKIVSTSIKKLDPNHLFIGSRLHSSAKNNSFLLSAAEKYCDIISINYYGSWEVTPKNNQQWQALNKPFIITEFYTKAVDSKMGNISGAGWLVKTQEDRGIHYQNFCLNLLQNNNCVGWHWFRYQDNDPNDPNADPSNKDSNKGLVNTFYEVYPPLAEKMKSLNENVYQLIKFIDKK